MILTIFTRKYTICKLYLKNLKVVFLEKFYRERQNKSRVISPFFILMNVFLNFFISHENIELENVRVPQI